MNKEITTGRLTRVLGNKQRANDWVANDTHKPIATVSRKRLVRSDWDFTSCLIIGVCSAAWMIACFRLIFQTVDIQALANLF